MNVPVIAADHAWRLDLSSLAAILAAAGTGLLAFFTWRLASETRDLAMETEEDVRAEWRPVVLQAADTVVLMTGGSTLATIIVMLRNVGRGPALNTWVTASSASSVEELRSDRLRLGTIVPGDAGVRIDIPDMLFRDSSGGPQAFLHYAVEASYEDLSGRSHTTAFVYEDGELGRRHPPLAQGQQSSFPLTLTLSDISINIAPRARHSLIRRLVAGFPFL